MRTNFHAAISPDDVPCARMVGETRPIPVLDLDQPLGRVTLQFQSHTPEATLDYLDALITEATKLRQQVAKRSQVAP